MASSNTQVPIKSDAALNVPRDRKSNSDQVKLDGVMKELVRNQDKAQTSMETRWSFLKNPRQHWEEEIKQRGLPHDILDRANRQRQPQEWGEARQPTAPLQPCEDLPVLTSGMIGWRAQNYKNHLDRIAGPLYSSPRFTVQPPPGPTEPDQDHQYYIFLG